MRIRLLSHVQNIHGSFKPGDVVDWPDEDAEPLTKLSEPAAEIVIEKEAKAPSGGEANTKEKP